MKHFYTILFCFCCASKQTPAQQIVFDNPVANSFLLSDVVICADPRDHQAIAVAVTLLQQDIERITGIKPELASSIPPSATSVIIIGSQKNSAVIRQLEQQGKFKPNFAQSWEAYQLQGLSQPIDGIRNALIICGSDERGTAYGVMEFSRQAGISPWYWWADVPVKKNQLYIQKNVRSTDAPKIKYRGIFINDEAPALSNWSREKFGGFNHKFYEKVFELMLRLKANYIWPAMWGNAFYDDDSLNIRLAAKYAIVIGTSHHEPLMRAHDEWRRYGKGKWNYDSNATALREFWKRGLARATNEKIVTVGMRGDGDEPMSRETATALLERIVHDQRNIIEEVTGKQAAATPQLWALYKEVQDYYDKGMRVPDDITLLLCDDNWGNIRKLPQRNEKTRKGGYGIYYHFDYVGGPRNYKWVNTNPIPRVWEQMHLAWEYGAREIWIVNVGDIKPMEFPISFFLDYAWNPEKIHASDLESYTEKWCSAQFGPTYSKKIAAIISKYSKYNGRRKPELLDAKTYNLESGETDRVTNEYVALAKQAELIGTLLEPEYSDAYFQLVLHPVTACANLYQLYTAVAHNHAAFARKSPKTPYYEQLAKEFYIKDSLITRNYHHLNEGKWNHMMSQTHIGYTYWQQPPVQKIPATFSLNGETINDTIIPAHNIAATLKSNPLKRSVLFENEKVIAIEASEFTRAVNSGSMQWQLLPDHGRTGSAMTLFPVTAASVMPGKMSPHLQYTIHTTSKDSFTIHGYFSPTLNFQNTTTGLQLAFSVDDEQPQVVSLNRDAGNVRVWEKWVADNIIMKSTRHFIAQPGKHTIKFWFVDAGVVLQKIVVDFGGMKKNYLGE